MRPAILNPLFAGVTSLKGVGPRFGAFYKKLCGDFVVDLLWHLPSDVIDRTYTPSSLRHAEKNRVATLTATVIEHQPPQGRGKPYRIVTECLDDTLALAYFNVKGDYLERLYPVGQRVTVSGFLERYRSSWVMNHPAYAVPADRSDTIPSFEPVYPLTAGLSGKMVQKTIAQALERAPTLPEWNDKDLLKREDWPAWKPALLGAHTPAVATPDEAQKKNLRRLAYDELLADQLALAIIRLHHKNAGGRAFKATGTITKKLDASLPFALTESQRKAIKEIANDMSAPKRMLRLLQGDVGAGKTLVALYAMLHAVEAGSQAALMAPTEILAKQHYATLSAFLKPLGLPIGLVLGRGRSKERQETLDALADGSLKLVVGTHALFQEDIAFYDLGFAVVDEQHRFGVNQRLLLSEKGRGVDILAMTATPIPRTLTLTAYGDMDVSRLTEKPAGRQKIDTRVIDMTRLDDVIQGIKRQTAAGAQVYWVCPLIEESENSDLAAATERAALLKPFLGNEAVGLVHGRMKSAEKDAAMQAFAEGKLKVLVATTVIEVGVDVPAASVMVVEHAERFGLAQLHQLRGRVGRGQEKSHCLLLYQAPLGTMAKARLTLLRETDDGFLIAEEDLRLRGAGELLGTRQSGLRLFRLADLTRDSDLLAMAHQDAAAVLAKDPLLESERGQALRVLLYLFAKDSSVPLLRAG
ncbi:MAG: ATP-dependent DNA helicase RecG [Alphaproteobacteria bacterium]|nr:ATP-dependent DNA helicase RecG [Alphaproteobacteria bacterium]